MMNKEQKTAAPAAELPKDVEWLLQAAEEALSSPEVATKIRNNCKAAALATAPVADAAPNSPTEAVPASAFQLIASARRQLRSALDTCSAEDRREYIRNAEADLEAAGKLEGVDDAAIPAGWKLVPEVPTPKMVDATFSHKAERNLEPESHNARNKRIYSAMLAAAPAHGAETK